MIKKWWKWRVHYYISLCNLIHFWNTFSLVKWFNIRSSCGLDNQINSISEVCCVPKMTDIYSFLSKPNSSNNPTKDTWWENYTSLHARRVSRLIWIWRHFNSGNQRSQSFKWAGRWIFWPCSQSLCAHQVTVTIIIIVPLKFWSDWTFGLRPISWGTSSLLY